MESEEKRTGQTATECPAADTSHHPPDKQQTATITGDAQAKLFGDHWRVAA
jgi:hypothetical protein